MLILRLLLLLSIVAPAWGALDGKRQELQELRSRIEQLKKDIEQASEDKAEAADALKQSERSISDVNRNLRELRLKQQALHRELAALAASTERSRAEIAAHQERLARLVLETYHRGGHDALQLILNGRDPAETARNLEYLRDVGRARNALIRDYQAALERLRILEKRTREQSERLEQTQREQLEQKRQLEAQKAEREGVLKRLAEQIRSQRREVDTLVRDEKRLARLIERLSRIAAKPERKAPGEGQPVKEVADASLAAVDFAMLKGRLALPVAGEILFRFGDPRQGGGPAWKGLFIRAPQGREVHAVGSGRVAFADWLRGFGNLLIIDHEAGFLSLYSNNESLYKQVGDRVRAGDVIATVGNSGGQEEPGLYFELRYQGRPFDPLSWVKPRNGS